MRLFAVLAALFAGACCTSLPRLPEKRIAFPSIAPETDRVSETSGVWHDAKRDRDEPEGEGNGGFHESL